MSELDRIQKLIQSLIMAGKGLGGMTQKEMMLNPSGLGSMSEYELAQMMQPSGLLGFSNNQPNGIVDGLLEQQFMNDILNSYDEMSVDAYNENRDEIERQLELQRLLDEERFFGRIR